MMELKESVSWSVGGTVRGSASDHTTRAGLTETTLGR